MSVYFYVSIDHVLIQEYKIKPPTNGNHLIYWVNLILLLEFTSYDTYFILYLPGTHLDYLIATLSRKKDGFPTFKVSQLKFLYLVSRTIAESSECHLGDTAAL